MSYIERSVSVMIPLKTGAVVNFAESIDTVPENIREVSPTVFIAVPRIWEKFYSSITILMKMQLSLASSSINYQ